MTASTKRDLELAREIIDKWKCYWMNQTQNSKQDYDNYFRRALGVDANMSCHLEKQFAKALAQARQDGRDSVLSKVPSEDELLSEYFNWEETKTEMALANCPSDVALWALEYIKRLNQEQAKGDL